MNTQVRRVGQYWFLFANGHVVFGYATEAEARAVEHSINH